MNKLSLSIALACAAFLGLIIGVFTMSRHHEQESKSANEKSLRLVGEIQRVSGEFKAVSEKLGETEDQLIAERQSKSEEISKLEDKLEKERSKRIEEKLKAEERMKLIAHVKPDKDVEAK